MGKLTIAAALSVSLASCTTAQLTEADDPGAFCRAHPGFVLPDGSHCLTPEDTAYIAGVIAATPMAAPAPLLQETAPVSSYPAPPLGPLTMPQATHCLVTPLGSGMTRATCN
jgi:hypothetical protein